MTDYVDAGEAVAHRQLSAVRQEAPPTGTVMGLLSASHCSSVCGPKPVEMVRR